MRFEYFFSPGLQALERRQALALPPALLGLLARRLAQVLAVQHDTLAVVGQHDDRVVGNRLARGRLTRLVEGVEVHRRPSHQLLRLALGHLRGATAGQLRERFVERTRRSRNRHPPAHLQRVPLCRQVQRRVERMQTVHTGPRVAGARDPHRAERRLDAPFVHPPLGALDTVGPRHRTGCFAPTTLVEMPLQELAHQLPTPPLQLPFEVALAHLPRFTRTGEGPGLGEGRIGRRIRRRLGGASRAGGGKHRSTCPQPLLRIPHPRIDRNRTRRRTQVLSLHEHPLRIPPPESHRPEARRRGRDP